MSPRVQFRMSLDKRTMTAEIGGDPDSTEGLDAAGIVGDLEAEGGKTQAVIARWPYDGLGINSASLANPTN
jgi:hypothetical protein